jgi:hypothetical protein
VTAPHAEQLIDGYLARLRVAATDLPASVRDELIEDMRAHIAEARTRETEETDATILNILDRLGEPELLVAEARRRPDAVASAPSAEPGRYRPGILEIAALVLLAFMWPVAVILLWISPAWNIRDKIIGTLLPPGGFPGIFYFGLVLSVAHVSRTSGGANGCTSSSDPGGYVVQNLCTGPSALQVIGEVVSVILLIILWLLPLVTVGYLAIRLRWGQARQASAPA